ncbi:unnamed protein product [Brassica oleracea]
MALQYISHADETERRARIMRVQQSIEADKDNPPAVLTKISHEVDKEKGHVFQYDKPASEALPLVCNRGLILRCQLLVVIATEVLTKVLHQVKAPILDLFQKDQRCFRLEYFAPPQPGPFGIRKRNLGNALLLGLDMSDQREAQHA